MKTCRIAALFVFTILALFNQVLSLTCECDKSNCQIPTCAGGVVLDSCQCCFVCAKLNNESCGGIFDVYGQCDMRLSCVIQPVHGQLVTDSEPGICKPAESLTSSDMCHETAYDGCNIVRSDCICGREVACSNPYQYQTTHQCELYLAIIQSTLEECAKSRCDRPISPICPDDSILVEGRFVPGECCPHPSRCECSKDRCAYNICHPDYDRVLVSKGNNEPGSCCDIYACQVKDTSQDECAKVRCTIQSLYSITCPEDSVVVRNPMTSSKCCPGEPICQCSSLTCTRPTCTGDMKLTVMYRGDGTPGSCCDEYACTNETVTAGCAVNGTHYEHGTTYDRDNCRTCECMSGISLCGKRLCPELKCKLKTMKRGACCATCHVDEGTNYPDYKPYPLCGSADGTKAYNVGESWSPQNCTYCTCEEGGVTRCKAAYCQEPTVIVISCPSMLECEISESSCPYGFLIDDNGCQLCRCRKDPPLIDALCPPLFSCKLNCPRGFEQNELGCDVCACKKKACSNLHSCKKDCPFGYKKNKKGCDRCKCKRCPLIDDSTCGKNCRYGLDVNKYGCSICKCKENLSSNSTATKIRTGSCLDSQSAVRHDDGEEWTSGCYFCVCRGGDVMCDVIMCPVPACNNPVKNPNDCCATCPDSTDTVTAVVPQSLTCQEPTGDWHVEGDTWSIDPCTSCICNSGHVMCTSARCPPTPCRNPVFEAGRCCPECSDFLLNVSIPNQDLTSTCLDGKYESGDVWHDDDCTSCVCFAGKVECYSERCPQVHDCVSPVLTLGQCCPGCLGNRNSPPKLCEDENSNIYNEGDTWNATCATCLCSGGLVHCEQNSCATLPSECESYRPLGECCDKCVQQETNTLYSHDETDHPSEQPDQPKPTAHTTDAIPLAIGISVSIVIAAVIIFGALYAKRRCDRGHAQAKYTHPPRALMMTRTISTTTQSSHLSTSSEDYPLTGQC